MAQKPTFPTIFENEISRRQFLETSFKVLLGVAAVELGAAGILFLRARSLEGKFGGVITAGRIEDFTAGSVIEFEEENFYLLVVANKGFMAIFRRCPHLGCTVNWVASKEKFYCPCHAASFDPNGDRLSTIVTRALDTFPVFFEDGLVKVDTSKVVNRERHKPEHFVYAS